MMVFGNTMFNVLNTKLLLVIIALLASVTAYLAYENRQLTAIADQLREQNRRLAAQDAERKADQDDLFRYMKPKSKPKQ